MKSGGWLLILWIVIVTPGFAQNCDGLDSQVACVEQVGCEWGWDEGLGCGVCESTCPTDVFLELTQFSGPGGSYPDPTVTVSCDEMFIRVQSNGMPHTPFNTQNTPNSLQAQNWTWEIPRAPIYSDTTTPITGTGGPGGPPTNCDVLPQLGTLGVVINGVPFYGPTEGPFPDPYGDPIYADGATTGTTGAAQTSGILDGCWGHTGGQADYHYHAFEESCFVTKAVLEASPILAFALDGFPVYGSRGCLDSGCTQIGEMKSSYEPKASWASNAPDCVMDHFEYVEKEGPEYLDECNGHGGPDGRYHYHATPTYPYSIGCYHGVVGEGSAVNDSETIAGDFNNDNSVDILDVVATVSIIISEGSIYNGYADMNGDCEVNVLDIIIIINLILGEQPESLATLVEATRHCGH